MMTQSSFLLGMFSAAGCKPFPGMVVDSDVIALHALISLPGGATFALAQSSSLLEVLNRWHWYFDTLSDFASAARSPSGPVHSLRRPVGELTVHAPLPEPRTIYCSGANYKKHVVDLVVAHQDQAETQGMTHEEKRAWGMRLMDERSKTGTPFIFIKPQSTVIGPFDPIVIPHGVRKPDWELELAVIIGRHARRVPRERALDYVAGYTIVNDITVRERVFRHKSDSPELGMDFTLSKGAPTFLPMGPYLVPAAFVADPQQLTLKLALNGQLMQDESTADMIFSVPHLIEYLTASLELQPGDIICTGSPAGNGMHYGRFIQDGDVLVGEIESPTVKFGSQRNPCIAEARTTG
jgi:2-keto-4-pentenoate hydratase/2-oxohepta-3-ene-1,7-dioic acid hydratase in catechol pathway